MSDSWSDPAFARIAELVGARTGLYFAPSRRIEAEAGIRRAMAHAEIAELARFAELLASGRQPIDELLGELTVGETYFFREPEQFEFMRRELFPALRAARGPDHPLRIWSAGCASGEEAYSLAIALEQAGLRGHVLGTDISRPALHKAREAHYGRWSLRGTDEDLLARFFQRARERERWTLEPRIARNVSFAFHNLALGACPSLAAGIWGMDLIFCRNVLIYFDKAALARVALALHASLAEDGWLILGASDPALSELAPFATVVTKGGLIYRRTGARPNAALAPLPRSAPAPAPAAPSPAPRREPERRASASVAPESPRARAPEPAALSALAQAAFEAGDYERALALTRAADDEAGAIAHVRALANCRGPELAEHEAARRAARFPLSAELRFLQAVLLLDLGREGEAVRALKRVLYLDRSLIVASFLLGSIARRRGRMAEAQRAFRNARDLARARPAQERLPLADGETAERIAEVADAELSLLAADREAQS